MSDLDAKIEYLKAEASERWGDRWYLDITLWSDGDFQAFAVRSKGVNDDGAVIRHRLFMNDDGDTAVDRVVVDEECIEMETLEPPDTGQSVTKSRTQ